MINTIAQSHNSAMNNCLANSEYQMEEGFVFANCNISRKDKVTYTVGVFNQLYKTSDKNSEWSLMMSGFLAA